MKFLLLGLAVSEFVGFWLYDSLAALAIAIIAASFAFAIWAGETNRR